VTALSLAGSTNASARARDYVQVVPVEWVIASLAVRFLRVVMPPARELVVLVIQPRACVQVPSVHAGRIVATVARFLVGSQRAAEGLRECPSGRQYGAVTQAESAVLVRVSRPSPRVARGCAAGPVGEGLEPLGVRHPVLNDSHVSRARIAGLAPSQVMCSAVPARVSVAGARGDRAGCHDTTISELNNYRRYLAGEATASPSPVTEESG
jgi:hypothetical protein